MTWSRPHMLRSWLLDGQTRISYAKCGFPLAVGHRRANLEQHMGAALALAQELAHPHSLAWTQNFAAWLHHRRREAPAVQVQAKALLTLATAQGFPPLVGYGTCWRGGAVARPGPGGGGPAQLPQGPAAPLAPRQTPERK